MQRAVALAVLLAAGTAAAAIAAPPVAMVIAPSTVRPGQTTTIGGVAGSCAVGNTVTLISRAFAHTHDFAGLPALFTPVRAGHKYRVTTRIPATKPAGTYRVTARCGGGNLGVSASIRVKSAVSLTVTPAVVHRGGVVTVHGSARGCPAGDQVTIISRAFAHTHDFAGLPAVFAKVRANGTFRTTTRIPATKPARLYGVTARCGGGNLGVVAHLRVLR